MESLIPRGNTTLDVEFSEQLQRTAEWLNSLPLARLDREREGLRPSVLGSYLCVSRPNVTKLLARLKDRGLVVEKSDPQDGRAVLAVITEEGIGLVQLAFVAVTRDLSTVVETLPQQDGAHLRTVLDRFRNGLFQALRASGCEEDSGLASI